ncbi:uncharacterized protein PHACADRAFT_148383 [Phanerochaete carnosa HHB-10118-sp]|uniref:Cx9C motif-containing protein 4, mitochondrial n=1 Tax=Phanerochaete carnosa (strain HHB-10118-sp) TaxID=650164 RepID=K5VQ97_PHACS|nr:uncharacterized protein PHACADRAFT_148383 [Phanerochaete carnosa HHB-10118-sp]EKM53653.1 hypothetical protein PHACADRAFT_148383 [Phanerochaete carnosa HHB-10118-sp]
MSLILLYFSACALQSCLNKHTYTPEKCSTHMRDLYQCCAEFYESTGDKGESTACPMPNVTRRWLKSHPPDAVK